MAERLRIGVSACLAGHPVRFDGGHRRDRLVSAWGAKVEWVPVCPEVELGLGAPRETLRLVAPGPSLIAPRSGRDLTAEMRRFAARRAAGLKGLDGFVVKKGSPTCGLERVRVYAGDGPPAHDGVGLFTEVLRATWPLLPVEDEGRLHDPGLRESFLRRVTVHHQLRGLFAPGWRLAQLVAFHASVKLDLMACSPAAYRELGRLVAHARSLDRDALAADYSSALLRALAAPPTPGRHANVLQHIAGYFRDHTSADERRELAELIELYVAGAEPRSAPLALLRHHARRRGHAWLLSQTYLQRSFA